MPSATAHDDGGALAEAADHRLLPGDPAVAQLVVEESAELLERVDEGVLVGVPDLLDHVPVPPARRDVGQRRARCHPEQPPVRVELVEQRIEIALVDAAAVQQDQRALGLAGRLASQMDQLDDLTRAVAARLLRRGHAGC